jgi:16S rRNA (guanine527-N7)-methyltransferase
MVAATADEALQAVLRDAQAEGFLGHGPVERHVEHGRALVDAVPRDAVVFVDLGSGGGIPGVVLALDRPDLSGALVDGSTRRGAFLSTAVARLGLAGRVQVLTERAELVGRSPHWRARVDVVVARSFGPPAVVAECAAPLLVPGGTLIVSDPPSERGNQARWPAGGLSELGLGVVVHRAGPPAFTVLEQVDACPDRFPRRVGIPAKRPHF